MKSSLVYIVILNWNGREDTLACLASVAKLDYENVHVVVVDNGSTDNSVEAVRAAFPDIEMVQTGANLGYAGGNNVGIRVALARGAEYIMLLNNDTSVAADLIKQFALAAYRHPDAGVLSARVLYYDHPHKVWFDGAKWNDTLLRMEWPGQGHFESELGYDDHETDYGCGAALFFRARMAEQIGLLDEKFFLVWEEVDWCYRARRAGWKSIVVPSAKVWHKIGVSFGSEGSPLRLYFSTRNALAWSRRHLSRPAQLRLLARNLWRLIPKWRLGTGTRANLIKRSLWATRDYGQSWMGSGSRLEYLSFRRAVVDYFRGRFGDCPPEVRAWSKAWAEIHLVHQVKNKPGERR